MLCLRGLSRQLARPHPRCKDSNIWTLCPAIAESAGWPARTIPSIAKHASSGAVSSRLFDGTSSSQPLKMLPPMSRQLSAIETLPPTDLTWHLSLAGITSSGVKCDLHYVQVKDAEIESLLEERERLDAALQSIKGQIQLAASPQSRPQEPGAGRASLSVPTLRYAWLLLSIRRGPGLPGFPLPPKEYSGGHWRTLHCKMSRLSCIAHSCLFSCTAICLACVSRSMCLPRLNS